MLVNDERYLQCQICCINYQNSFFYVKQECDHKFCKYCIFNYLINCINTNNVLRIKCPYVFIFTFINLQLQLQIKQNNCQQCYVDKNIEELIDENSFKKYIQFKKILIINQDPSLKWCCKEGCNKYVKANEKSNQAKCECGNIMCFLCGNDWHEGITCQDKMQEDFQQAIYKYEISFCPNCTVKVEKVSGCNKMTCPMCQVSFCWLCKLINIRYSHFNYLNIFGCPGRQYNNQALPKNYKLRNYLTLFPKLILIVLIALLLIIAFPIVVAVIAVLTPNYIYRHNTTFRQRRKHKKAKIIGLLILGITFVPLFLIPAIYILFKIVKQEI
ncbi:ibr domain protein [Ichthyophthirius multifiliis]|uniref:Ibr domain protein n=1 Tax=Ichthyophthirius multifiliis TaxID=5932 RepID=G0R0Y8_ICHMU|nr:ibr domain protein [Ichthyophthirius multifiliis]EGR28853.1 ibr domain protein [Ichthyophthirius multifiliis]|eukprot:XP_004030089.1 ibr domain protein [Ichthyophthirius multifiliis]